MKIKIKQYEIEGNVDEVLGFVTGYEMRRTYKNAIKREEKKQEKINNLMERLLDDE